MLRASHPAAQRVTRISRPGTFNFELDFAGTLYCIPMSVRLKLDACGIKLSLKQWNRLPEAQRQRLLSLPGATEFEVSNYRALLVTLIETHTASAAETFAPDSHPEWANLQATPARVSTHAHKLGISPPSAQQWAALQPVQRFALFKLTRPGHANDNFLPAMREFGFLDAD